MERGMKAHCTNLRNQLYEDFFKVKVQRIHSHYQTNYTKGKSGSQVHRTYIKRLNQILWIKQDKHSKELTNTKDPMAVGRNILTSIQPKMA